VVVVRRLETVNSVLSVAIRAEFSAASLIGMNHNQTELNDAERAKIYELVVANEAMKSPIDVDASHKVNGTKKSKH
jgi:nuclear receptor subfamily 1 group I